MTGKAENLELLRLARRGDRAGVRARVALAIGRGERPAQITSSLHVTFTTVRAVRRRLAIGGVAALRERYAPSAAGEVQSETAARTALFDGGAGFKAPVPDVLLRRHGEGASRAGRRGRVPAARIAIEVWVRDATALGLFPPGSRLPEMRWFQKRFSATCGTVRRAFDALQEGGWARRVPRIGTFSPARPPFAGRHLMLLGSPVVRPRIPEGIDAALARAAREQEARRPGVRWDIRDALPSGAPGYCGLLAAIAEQRWAGVFLRSGVRILGDTGGRGHYCFLDRVPMSGFLHPILRIGSHVRRLSAKAGREDGRMGLDAMLRAVRAAGRQRALVLDVVAKPDADIAAQEADARRRAGEAGVEIPSDCYVPCPTSPGPGQIDPLAALALRVAEAERCDAILALQDNYAEPLDRALVARYGAAEAARRYFLAAWGSRPVTQKTELPFEWHGHDLSATLDSFVDWCAAIHAGEQAPPPPALALF